MHETPIERVLVLTRDILRIQHLDSALESIAQAVKDLYAFKYVTIVAADTSGGNMTRRVMLGWPESIIALRKYESVSREKVSDWLKPAFEVVENGYYIAAERELEWDRSIYAGERPRNEPRLSPDAWHERDGLAFVLPDARGEMLAYISVDGPHDGKIPSRETLNSMMLFVNLTGLALANAQAHAAEIERRELLELSQARLSYEATHDPLTRLPNRTAFSNILRETLTAARMHADSIHAVLFIDLDEFKSINDSLGHLAGDQVLVAVADRMRRTANDGEFVARIGGDEFAILVSDRREIGEVDAFVHRIQDALVRPIEVDGRAMFVTASIGISLVRTDHETNESVLRNADTAMYHAKAIGRARHAYFDEHMHLEVSRRLTLTSDLRLAIEREQFTVVYQPIVQIADGTIVGFEALVRWHNPQTGEILPGEFIPLAEEVGLVVQIGRFVIVEACRELAQWRTLAPHLDLRMHVNLSVQEALQPELGGFVARNLARFGLDAGSVMLEVTETAIMRSGSAAISALERLRETGVNLCIDDFGTGYSSLRYLHQFPVDCLKIDRSFVESPEGTLASPPIVRMMIQLAELYDIDVVAEGVETPEQARSLLELDCAYAQGYYFYRPMSADAVVALLSDQAVPA